MRDAMTLSYAIRHNQKDTVAEYYDKFDKLLMTYKNIEKASALLESFYAEILENLQTTQQDLELNSLQKKAGTVFSEHYEESLRQLEDKKKVIEEARQASIKAAARHVTQEDLALQRLQHELPTLPIKEIQKKLINYINDCNRKLAEEIVNFIISNYTNPSDVWGIIRAINRSAELNDTFSFVIDSLRRHHLALTAETQKQPADVSEKGPQIKVQVTPGSPKI